MSSERNIIARLMEGVEITQDDVAPNVELEEASFDANGKHYSCAFGHYSCDGEPISRDDYFSAKEGNPTSTGSSGSASNAEPAKKPEPEIMSDQKLSSKEAINFLQDVIDNDPFDGNYPEYTELNKKVISLLKDNPDAVMYTDCMFDEVVEKGDIIEDTGNDYLRKYTVRCYDPDTDDPTGDYSGYLLGNRDGMESFIYVPETNKKSEPAKDNVGYDNLLKGSMYFDDPHNPLSSSDKKEYFGSVKTYNNIMKTLGGDKYNAFSVFDKGDAMDALDSATNGRKPDGNIDGGYDVYKFKDATVVKGDGGYFFGPANDIKVKSSAPAKDKSSAPARDTSKENALYTDKISKGEEFSITPDNLKDFRSYLKDNKWDRSSRDGNLYYGKGKFLKIKKTKDGNYNVKTGSLGGH